MAVVPRPGHNIDGHGRRALFDARSEILVFMFGRTFVAALALVCCAQASAQVYKCKDAAGKLTYSSRVCSEIGLISGGEVTGQINMIPANKPAPTAAANPAPAARAAPVAPAPKTASSDPSAQEPRRCFVVTKVIKTPKGNQTVKNTRCDGDPADAG